MPRLVPARLLAALRPDPGARHELHSDLVRESRHRVRVAAAIGALAYTAFLAVELAGLIPAPEPERSIDRIHDLAGAGLCVLLLVVASLPAIGDRAAIAAALAVEVLLSAVISTAAPWTSYLRTGHVTGLTWVVPIIILFPLLVPAPPRIGLVVSILCAATMPIGLWALAAAGAIRAAPQDFIASCLTGAVAVGISYVASQTVHGAHRHAAAARNVGSYELLERLGQGGMGEVWKARHSFLARPAAVKLILHEALRGPSEERVEVTRRFTREAQVTAGLRSPHTVTLFDFGVSADGVFYYAMELLDGMNLEHFVYRYGPLEPRRAVSWLQQACHSLGEAHSQSLVHRDIKPSNLFICRYGRDTDFIKVLDFGLTQPVTPATDTKLTAPGVRMGTPGYMAPEQVFGLPADSRTDLYALGCVGYFLLAGVKPFEADTAAELMRQHAQADPPPLAGRTRGAVPARLEATIMACLHKDPRDRPTDTDRLSADLEQCLDGARWTDGDGRDWWQKNM